MIRRRLRSTGQALGHWLGMRSTDEAGAVAIMTALLLIVLFAIGMLALNWGIAVAARASVRRAADAGVLAGCQDLPDATKARTAAELYSTSAGGKNARSAVQDLESGNGDQVADPPPAITSSGATGAGGGVLVNDQIRVDVRRTQWLFGVASWAPIGRVMNIDAYAICRRDEGGLAVLHALGSGPRTLRLDGSDLDLPRGGIIVNSTDPRGLDALGNSTVDANWIETGSGMANVTGSSTIDPYPPATNTRPDPYASVPQPAIPSPGDPDAPIQPQGCAQATTARNPLVCVVDGSMGTNVVQGEYYGGLRFSVNATMGPGVYHMVGGGFVVDPGVTVTSTGGVMIFNDSNPYPQQAPRKQCGAVLIQEGARLLITPIGGQYQEVMIFQRRTVDPRTGSNDPDCLIDVWVQGGVTIGLAAGPYGAIYTPNSRSLFGPQGHGSSSLVAELNIIVVADRIDLTGPILFADIFIPSGDVRHGDIHLVE